MKTNSLTCGRSSSHASEEQPWPDQTQPPWPFQQQPPWGISLSAPKCDKLLPLDGRNLPRTETQGRKFPAALFATRSMSPLAGPSKSLPRRLAVLVVLRARPSYLGLQFLPRLDSDSCTSGT